MSASSPSLAQLLARHTREGELYEKLPNERVRCFACGHLCLIPPGREGVCRVRFNEGGILKVPLKEIVRSGGLGPVRERVIVPASDEAVLETFVRVRRNHLYVVDEGRFLGAVNLHDLNGALRDAADAFAARHGLHRPAVVGPPVLLADGFAAIELDGRRLAVIGPIADSARDLLALGNDV